MRANEKEIAGKLAAMADKRKEAEESAENPA